MSIKLWICKRLTKRIEKKEQQILKLKIAINTLNKWIKQDKKKLNERLKQLTDEENLEYGLQNGFIDQADLGMVRKANMLSQKKYIKLKTIKKRQKNDR